MKTGEIIDSRWQIVKTNIGGGGQSVVHLVKDIANKSNDEFALKEIKRFARHDRFRNEIEACKKLSHTNVVRLVDHSGLDEAVRQNRYLVTPFAHGGSLKDREEMYKGSLDSTLKVALALSKGLDHAHQNKVIHRDVKPANILFFGLNSEPAICDFGICLVRELDRHTEVDEVVGPRNFMAPELEGGGQLDVSESVDIYSLGKVIYYMITGGRIVPRERHRDKEYDIFEGKGIRHQFLGLLLDRMICSLENRIDKMSKVSAELERIISWEEKREQTLSPNILGKFTKMVNSEQQKSQIQSENADVAKQQKQLEVNFLKNTYSWLGEYIEKLVETMKNDQMEFKVFKQIGSEEVGIVLGTNHIKAYGVDGAYIPEYFVGFSLTKKTDRQQNAHSLLFFMSKKVKVSIQFSTDKIKKSELVDMEYCLFPFYFKKESWRGFINKKSYSSKAGGSTISKSFHGRTTTICQVDKVSNWPANIPNAEKVIEESLEQYLEYIESGHQSIGG